MSWDAVAAIAEAGGAIAVIATLAYLAVQARQNSALLAASVANSNRDAANEITRVLANNPEAARIYWAGLEGRGALADIDQKQFDALMQLAFTHHNQGFAQGSESEMADRGCAWTMQFRGARDWWEVYAANYPTDFQAHVNRLIAAGAPSAQQSAAADSARAE